MSKLSKFLQQPNGMALLYNTLLSAWKRYLEQPTTVENPEGRYRKALRNLRHAEREVKRAERQRCRK